MNKAEENNLSSDFQTLTFKTFSNFFGQSQVDNTGQKGEILLLFMVSVLCWSLYIYL